MIRESLTFDDTLIVPKYSTIKSRSEVNLSVKLSKGISFNLPFVPANMADITGEKMMRKMYELKSLSLLHRFLPIDDQVNIIKNISSLENIFNYAGVSVGVKPEDYQNIKTFTRIGSGVKIICIDIAHLDCISGTQMIEYIHTNYPDILLIAGNVATGSAAVRAWRAGADIVKVGIGASGICSTRLEAGIGVGQLSALMDVYEAKTKLQNEIGRELFFISDGGHRKSSDCVKSLCFANMVMLGGMFSGTDESEGIVINAGDEIYKSYSGSSTHKSHRIEGVKGIVKSKGPIDGILKTLSEGLQSSCSYQNCRNLDELKEDPEFVRVTHSGLAESKIYGVTIQGDK
jgi:IMP dehydrogenase